MLQNVVKTTEEQRQVNHHGDLMADRSGVPLSYDAYSYLLLAAASAYDDQHQHKKIKDML